MGMCVSTSKKDVKKANKLHDTIVSPEDHDKEIIVGEIPVIATQPGSVSSVASIRDHDSKEETFFDSQPWLNSDSDDDFMSVNGDFASSRCSTPRHPNFSPKIPSSSKSAISDKITSLKAEEPPNKKRSLVELFRDSIRIIDHSNNDEHNVSSEVNETTSEHKLQCEDNAAITNEENEIKRKPSKYIQCCIPRSLNDRRSIKVNTKMCPPPAFTAY